MLLPEATKRSEASKTLIAGFALSILASLISLGVFVLSHPNLDLEKRLPHFLAYSETQIYVEAYILVSLVLFCLYFGLRLRRTSDSAMLCGSMLFMCLVVFYFRHCVSLVPALFRYINSSYDILFLLFSAIAPTFLSSAVENGRVKVSVQLLAGLCAALGFYLSLALSIILCLMLQVNFHSFITFVIRQAVSCSLYYLAMTIIFTPGSGRLIPAILLSWIQKFTLSKVGFILFISMSVAGLVWAARLGY